MKKDRQESIKFYRYFDKTKKKPFKNLLFIFNIENFYGVN